MNGGNCPRPVQNRIRQQCNLAGRLRAVFVASGAERDSGIITTVHVLYSGRFLYFGWQCPFTQLTVFDAPCAAKERLGLWDRDVAEVFVGSDWTNHNSYFEYEVAPTNERLDVLLNLPEKNFAWDCRGQSAVRLDKKNKV
jgi:hypothetical protein